MTGLLSVDAHLADILARVHLLDERRMSPVDAAGRTLVSPAVAALDIPAFDNSAMDGFAVRSADVAQATAEAPVALAVASDVPAGSVPVSPVAPGTTQRIMTGAPVPPGADAIVPFEQTAGGLANSLDTASVLAAPSVAGAHIRRRAEDIATGDTVLRAGTVLGALQVPALVAAGVTEVAVARAPRVVVASTGSELSAPGSVPAPGQIPDSNSTLLAGLVREAGGEIVVRTRVGDDPAELTRLLHDHPDVDAVITSGGVSAGAYEPVKQALDGIVRFSKVAMQPGKPQAFGALETGALFFGLPGNPVSVAVSFEAFVRPALLAMQGRTTIRRPLLRLPAATGWRTPPARRQYAPIIVERADPAAWRVRPATAGGSGSHLVGGLGLAEGYAIVSEDVAAVATGDLVDVMLVT